MENRTKTVQRREGEEEQQTQTEEEQEDEVDMKLIVEAAYFNCTPGRSPWEISAMTEFGSIDLVFSSTQFSGSRSLESKYEC